MKKAKLTKNRGLIFLDLEVDSINPFDDLSGEVLTEDLHLSVDYKGRETSLKITLGDLVKEETHDKIIHTLKFLWKDDEYIKSYLELIAQKINPNDIIKKDIKP